MASKIRMLYIYQFLFDKSDELHPLSTTMLLILLERKSIICEKKAIYADIETLRMFGYDIVLTDSPRRGYFLANRIFEFPEVRLLIDAVQSASFITVKKTQQLLEKLERLTSEYCATDISNQVYVDKRIKCKNERIYYSIDQLHTAIVEKKKVIFLYLHKTLDRCTGSTVREKVFKVSPYALIWNNDHYYLACNYEKYDNTMNLRVDKMVNVQLIDEVARDFSQVSNYVDKFDAADYAKKQFNMFVGETETVELICDLSLLDTVSDKFGEDATLRIYDNQNLLVVIEAAISDGLVSWIMQYGDKIKIVSPESLTTLFVEKMKQINQLYNIH